MCPIVFVLQWWINKFRTTFSNEIPTNSIEQFLHLSRDLLIICTWLLNEMCCMMWEKRTTIPVIQSKIKKKIQSLNGWMNSKRKFVCAKRWRYLCKNQAFMFWVLQLSWNPTSQNENSNLHTKKNNLLNSSLKSSNNEWFLFFKFYHIDSWLYKNSKISWEQLNQFEFCFVWWWSLIRANKTKLFWNAKGESHVFFLNFFFNFS